MTTFTAHVLPIEVAGWGGTLPSHLDLMRSRWDDNLHIQLADLVNCDREGDLMDPRRTGSLPSHLDLMRSRWDDNLHGACAADGGGRMGWHPPIPS